MTDIHAAQQSPREHMTRPPTRYLAKAAALEETGVPRMIRLTLLTVSAMVAAAIAWAAITKVD